MSILNKKVLFLGWDQEYETTSIDAIKNHHVNRLSFYSWISIFYNKAPVFLKEKIEYILWKYIDFRYHDYDMLIVPDNLLFYKLGLKISIDYKVMVIRNIIKDREYLLTSKEFIYHTFDSKDAKKYNLNLYNQFLHIESCGEEDISSEKYDLYYLGLIKNRRLAIEQLIKSVEHSHLTSLILVKERPTSLLDRLRFKLGVEKDIHRLIPYSQNVKYVEQSKIIVDIVNENQAGLTLRILEALFLNKKIITNNKQIIKYDFFNERSIKIVNFDSKDEICQVLNNKEFLSESVSYNQSCLDEFRGSIVLEEIINVSQAT
ncbi:hypothetical protein AB4428_11265 [Vibrio lentus]